MSKEEKQPYEDEAAADRERYRREMLDFSYNTNGNIELHNNNNKSKMKKLSGENTSSDVDGMNEPHGNESVDNDSTNEHEQQHDRVYDKDAAAAERTRLQHMKMGLIPDVNENNNMQQINNQQINNQSTLLTQQPDSNPLPTNPVDHLHTIQHNPDEHSPLTLPPTDNMINRNDINAQQQLSTDINAPSHHDNNINVQATQSIHADSPSSDIPPLHRSNDSNVQQ